LVSHETASSSAECSRDKPPLPTIRQKRQCPLTVKHILMECVDLNDIRNKHFVASSIKDLFENVEASKIIDFIKETGFISIFNVFKLTFVIYFLF